MTMTEADKNSNPEDRNNKTTYIKLNMAKGIPKTARQLEKVTSSPHCIPQSLTELVEHGVSPRSLTITFKVNQ